MSDPMLKLQLVVRAELALAEIRARRTASRTTYLSIALVFLLLGIGMMTLALFNALKAYMSPAWAAFCVASLDLVIGLIFVLAARRAGPSENEEKLARQLREMAYTELGSDIQEIKDEFSRISGEVSRIRSGITSFAGGSIAPLISMLLRSGRK